MDGELFLSIAALLLMFAGGLFARFFPRLGLVLGWAVMAGSLGALLWVLAAFVKAFGAFWGLAFGGVFSIPAGLAMRMGAAMVRVGSGVLEDEEARKLVAQRPEARPEPTVTKDIEAFIDRRFPPMDRESARALLDEARLYGGKRLGPRLARCALFLSRGSLEALREQLARARRNPNDVIFDAECAPAADGMARIRDLGEPFDAHA